MMVSVVEPSIFTAVLAMTGKISIREKADISLRLSRPKASQRAVAREFVVADETVKLLSENRTVV